MTTARSRLLLASITWLVFASVDTAHGETIDRVKDLYRSAAYEDALAVLDQMAKESGPTNPVEAREYRLLCLIALERRTEARDAIASMVNADPFYQLPQASPRVRTMFKDVRQSLLPTIAQQAYADAKAAFDRKDPESGAQFERVLTLLNDPDISGVSTVADLRTVASAFRDLSQVLKRAPDPPTQIAPPAAPDNVAPSMPALPIVYRDGEPGLVVPEALNQTLPRWVLPARRSGAGAAGLAGRAGSPHRREWRCHVGNASKVVPPRLRFAAGEGGYVLEVQASSKGRSACALSQNCQRASG